MNAPRPILLHGTVGGPTCWSGQDGHIPGAAAIAMPGHPTGTPLRAVGEAAVFVARLLERVPGPKALVGHDLGAAIALEVALREPGLVDGVVAVACGPVLPGLPATGVEDAIHAALRDGLTNPSSDAADAVATAMRAAGAPALDADTRMARDVDLAGRLGALEVPVLLVAGGDDPVVPPAAVAALADEIPVRESVVVPGARHVVMADRPGTFNLLLAAFLARLELTLDDR